jgi:low affinity Fe/Cu permease
MSGSRRGALSRRMESFSGAVTDWTGTTKAFLLALGAVLVWLLTGPVFRYSDTWQLVINTATTVITFLMVFLIQRAQNKSARWP